jgi:hypothetical protein
MRWLFIAIILTIVGLIVVSGRPSRANAQGMTDNCPPVRIATYTAGDNADVQGVWGYWNRAPAPTVCASQVAYHLVRIDNGPTGGVGTPKLIEIGILVTAGNSRVIYSRCSQCSPQMANHDNAGGFHQFWIWYDVDNDMWRWFVGDANNNWREVRHASSSTVGFAPGTRVLAGGETQNNNSQLGMLFHNELAVYRYNGGSQDANIYASQFTRYVPDGTSSGSYLSHCGGRYYTMYWGAGTGQGPGGEGTVGVATNGGPTCP